MNILALDVGTARVKAAVLEVPAGQFVGPSAEVGFTLDSPTPEAAEVPAERLWEAVARAARAAVQSAGVSGQPAREIRAVALTTFMPGLVLVGQDDKPLLPIWTPLDRRARGVARQVWAGVGPEFLATTGNRPLPGAISVLSYRQLVNDEPYLTHNVKSYLHVNGWLALHMTGERSFDRANASSTGLFGTPNDLQWSQRWCDYFDVERPWLPPIVCGKTTVGMLRADPAAELGVPAGIPLKLGTNDLSSVMLAADMKPGDLLHMTGATQVLATRTDKLAPAPERLTHCIGVGTGFVHVAFNPVGHVALDWLHQLCFRDVSKADFHGPLCYQALERKTRVCLDPPYLNGDPLEIEARRAAFRDLQLSADRLDLLAALLHALLDRHREAVKNLGLGTAYQRILLTGSGAEIMQQLVPEYRTGASEKLEDGALRGVAKLFVD